MVDGGKRRFGIDNDHAVHTVSDMLRNISICAVVHENARIEQTHMNRAGLPGIRRQRCCATSLPGDRMKVDVVWVMTTGPIRQRNRDEIADPSSNHGPGRTTENIVVSRDPIAPHLRAYPVCRVERADPLDRLEVDLERALIGPGNWRRDVRRHRRVHLVLGRRRQIRNRRQHRPDTDGCAPGKCFRRLGLSRRAPCRQRCGQGRPSHRAKKEPSRYSITNHHAPPVGYHRESAQVPLRSLVSSLRVAGIEKYLAGTSNVTKTYKVPNFAQVIPNVLVGIASSPCATSLIPPVVASRFESSATPPRTILQIDISSLRGWKVR